MGDHVGISFNSVLVVVLGYIPRLRAFGRTAYPKTAGNRERETDPTSDPEGRPLIEFANGPIGLFLSIGASFLWVPF